MAPEKNGKSSGNSVLDVQIDDDLGNIDDILNDSDIGGLKADSQGGLSDKSAKPPDNQEEVPTVSSILSETDDDFESITDDDLDNILDSAMKENIIIPGTDTDAELGKPSQAEAPAPEISIDDSPESDMTASVDEVAHKVPADEVEAAPAAVSSEDDIALSSQELDDILESNTLLVDDELEQSKNDSLTADSSASSDAEDSNDMALMDVDDTVAEQPDAEQPDDGGTETTPDPSTTAASLDDAVAEADQASALSGEAPSELAGETADNTESSFFDDDTDTEIALSDKELDSILSDSEISEISESEETADMGQTAEEPQAVSADVTESGAAEKTDDGFFKDADGDETIALSESELDNILSDADIVDSETTVPASDESLSAQDLPAETLDDMDDLKDGRLDEPVKGAGEIEELEELELVEEEENAAIPKDEGDAGALTGAAVAGAGIAGGAAIAAGAHKPEEKPPTDALTGQDLEDLKKLLKHLDEIFDRLPGEEIEKFANSEYYDLYNKIFDTLGL